MLKKPLFFPLLFFIFIFAIYFMGISKSVYGGDSGDIILAAFFGGVAHPPGYPLNSILGFLFTHLPIGGTLAYKADIMMALFSAGAIVFLFLALKSLVKNFFVALTAALVLAFSPLFWLYAHVTEVFQLNLLLISISVYFLSLSNGKASKYLYLSIFFLGLAVFHHQTAVLVLPAYLYLIYRTDKKTFRLSKQFFYITLAFLAGAIPYVFVPLLAAKQTPINWDNAVNLPNLLHLLARSDYGTFAASQSFVGSSFQARLLQIISYFAFIGNDFTLLGSLLIILGAIYSYFENRKIFWFLALAVFFTGPFFLFYSSFSLSSDFLFGIWERFILLSYFFLVFYLGWGLYFLYKKAPLLFLKLHLKKELGMLILGLAFFLLPLYMVRANWSKADMSEFELGDWLGHDVLASSSTGSLIFLFDDTTAFNTQYVYYTGKEFSDRKLVLGGILRHKFYREQLLRQYPDLIFPSGFFEDNDVESSTYLTKLINANVGKIPIYSVDFSPSIEGYAWVTSGLLKMLVTSTEVSNAGFIKESNRLALKSFSININEINSGYGNFIPQSIKRFYGFSFNEMGDQMLQLNSFEEAGNYYKIALAIQPNDPRAFFGVGRTSLELGDCANAKAFLLRAHDLDGQNTRVFSVLADEARRCEKNEQLAKQYEEEAKRINRLRMEKL